MSTVGTKTQKTNQYRQEINKNQKTINRKTSSIINSFNKILCSKGKYQKLKDIIEG